LFRFLINYPVFELIKVKTIKNNPEFCDELPNSLPLLRFIIIAIIGNAKGTGANFGPYFEPKLYGGRYLDRMEGDNTEAWELQKWKNGKMAFSA
jgi:hypothetical protein